MAVIHHTTLVPGKLDLLSDWLPAQSWYVETDEELRVQRLIQRRDDDYERAANYRSRFSCKRECRR